ncbi:MAG: phage holin family protein [Rikenellaceae bacterium]|jgi:phage-related holin|nr:phage holin family protein [Rikenellaceae bacterium]
MENLLKYAWGLTSGVCALLVPVRGLIVCAMVFVAIDFVTGVIASRCRARRAHLAWSFSSRRAWNTVVKLIFVMAGIVLAWMLESVVLTFAELHLAKIFTGFVCGVEFRSYLENAADISEHPLFTALKTLVKGKIDRTLDK